MCSSSLNLIRKEFLKKFLFRTNSTIFVVHIYTSPFELRTDHCGLAEISQRRPKKRTAQRAGGLSPFVSSLVMQAVIGSGPGEGATAKFSATNMAARISTPPLNGVEVSPGIRRRGPGVVFGARFTYCVYHYREFISARLDSIERRLNAGSK